MKVQLVANLAANGQLILAEHSTAYTAPEEISGMAIAKAMECGNLIMGLTTYQMFAPLMKEVFASLDVVVLAPRGAVENACCVQSAEEAVKYLEGKGCKTACVCGGTATYNAFLEAGLADDLFFNLFPVVIGSGGILETAANATLKYNLVEAKAYKGIAMLHFAAAKDSE